jgi:hypothetical protein
VCPASHERVTIDVLRNKEMSTKRLIEQHVDNSSSNDDLKRSINTLPTSDPKDPAPNPFVVRRKPSQGETKQEPASKD